MECKFTVMEEQQTKPRARVVIDDLWDDLSEKQQECIFHMSHNHDVFYIDAHGREAQITEEVGTKIGNIRIVRTVLRAWEREEASPKPVSE